MPNPGVVFNRTNVIIPGAYSNIDASQLTPSSAGLANVVAIIGQATGGPPGVVQWFRSGDTAKKALRSGDLLDAIRFAYAPATDPNAGGADLIAAIRVNPATQSTLSLAGATGTPVVLTSVDYGVWTTGIQVKVEAGSTSGKKVTIQYVDATQGTLLEVYDNMASSVAIVAAINGGIAGGQPPSQFVTAATGTGTDPLTNAAFAPLAGGVEGTTTSTQWTAALNALALEEVDIVVPMTNDPTITALVQAHCDSLSGTKARKERICFLGGSVAATFGTTDLYVTDLVSKAVALASSRAILMAPGIRRYNALGVLTLYPPQFTAACAAGLAAALEIGQSPTGKFLKVQSLDAAFTQSQEELLLLGGVSPVEFVKDQGFRIVQSLTTWQADANPYNREYSVKHVGDYIMKTLRKRLEIQFGGVRGDQSTLNSMLNAVTSMLADFLQQRAIVGFQNVSISIQQSVARVSFEFAPSEPINYILISGFAKPASLAVSFSGQASYTGAQTTS